jgi:hypothetical protein
MLPIAQPSGPMSMNGPMNYSTTVGQGTLSRVIRTASTRPREREVPEVRTVHKLVHADVVTTPAG